MKWRSRVAKDAGAFLLLLLLAATAVAATPPEAITMLPAGASVTVQSDGFPGPYPLLAGVRLWQFALAPEASAAGAVLTASFADLELHPASRLNLFDGDPVKFQLAKSAHLLARLDGGVDSGRRVAAVATETGVLTVIFHAVAPAAAAGSADSTPAVGFRLHVSALAKAEAVALAATVTQCGRPTYAADSNASIEVPGSANFDCVWLLRPMAGAETASADASEATARFVGTRQVGSFDLEARAGATSTAPKLLHLRQWPSASASVSVLVAANLSVLFNGSSALYLRLRGGCIVDSSGGGGSCLQLYYRRLLAPCTETTDNSCGGCADSGGQPITLCPGHRQCVPIGLPCPPGPARPTPTPLVPAAPPPTAQVVLLHPNSDGHATDEADGSGGGGGGGGPRQQRDQWSGRRARDPHYMGRLNALVAAGSSLLLALGLALLILRTRVRRRAQAAAAAAAAAATAADLDVVESGRAGINRSETVVSSLLASVAAAAAAAVARSPSPPPAYSEVCRGPPPPKPPDLDPAGEPVRETPRDPLE